MAVDQERHRLECEARWRLKQTGGKKAAVDEMIEKVTQKRGKKAADELRAEMLRQHIEEKEKQHERERRVAPR